MKKQIFFFVLFILLINCKYIFADIRAEVFINRKVLRIGEILKYRIKIIRPENYLEEKFDITSSSDSFSIVKKQESSKKVFFSNEIKKEYIFYLIAMELGKQKINGLEINLKNKFTGEIKIVKIPEIEVQIFGIKKQRWMRFDGPIIDIKNPFWIRNWLLIILFFIFIIVFLFYYIYKENQHKIELKQKEEVQRIDYKELSLKKLDELWQKDYISRNMIKEFYLELTEIVRGFVATKYRINALELTTDELFAALKKKVEKRYNLELKSFLEMADLAKFAKYVPSLEDIKKDFEKSKELILKDL